MVLKLGSDEVVRMTQNLNKLQAKANGYSQQIATGRNVTILACVSAVLLLLLIILAILYFRKK
jgi:hypothetical protein